MPHDPRALADPFSWGGLIERSDEERRRPSTVSRFTDARRSFLAPFWRALREYATPADVDAMTPSHIAALLGWDEEQIVRLVPMTDEEAAGPVRRTAPAPGAERKLRRVM